MKIILLVACFVGLSYGMMNDEDDMMRGMDNSVNGLSHKVTEDTDDVTVEQIVDSHGKVLNEVIRLNLLNIQIDKPVDEKTCYIKDLRDDHVCFTEDPVTDAIPPEVREHCEGRKVKQLNPKDCDDKRDNSARGSLDIEEDIRELLDHMKRACVVTPTQVCVEKCGWWKRKCCTYETRYITHCY